VYGASDATAGELVADGSFTGSAYGTSDGVVGRTQFAGVTVLVLVALPLVVAAFTVLAPAGVAPAVKNETTATAATAAAGSLPAGSAPEGRGTFLLFGRERVAIRNGPLLRWLEVTQMPIRLDHALRKLNSELRNGQYARVARSARISALVRQKCCSALLTENERAPAPKAPARVCAQIIRV
jgi:hypothetical protein